MSDNDKVKEAGAVETRCELGNSVVYPGFSKVVREGVSMVVHEDCRVKNVSMFADYPYRRAGRVKLLTLADFKAYVVARSQVLAPTVFVDERTVCAVHNMEGWQDDCTEFKLERTPEWTEWNAQSGRWMSQESFCDFLEDHLGNVVAPCGAELLELVANFRQMTRVEYGSSYRGSDGQIMLEYKERKEGAGGRDMALPAEFMLHLPVVKGAEAMTTYELKARLRVRVQEDHKLALQYTLVRPDIPADNAISDIVEHLREALTDAAVYAGLIPVTCMDKLSSL